MTKAEHYQKSQEHLAKAEPFIEEADAISESAEGGYVGGALGMMIDYHLKAADMHERMSR